MKALDIVLHIGVGAVLAALVGWNLWFMVLATFVYAFLREQAQHRYVLIMKEIHIEGGEDGHHQRLYEVDKRGFFDFSWLGGRQVWEIAQWTIGSVVACGVWEVM